MTEFTDSIERGKQSPFTAIMTVTPDLAEAMLSTNNTNRKVRSTKVQQFSSDIVAGRWAFNGEPIIFAATGELNDGQHRLEAVIEAGMPIVTNVVFGVSRETRFTLDQGSARAAGDHLGLMGVTNPNETAKAARMLIAYDNSGGKNLARANRISSAEILARVSSDNAISAAITEMAGVPREARPTLLSLLAFWRVLAKQNKHHIEFVTTVANGENLAASDPAYQVRLRLMRGDNRTNMAQTEIYMRGLNAFMRGDGDFRIRLAGEFPVIKAR